MFDPYSESPDSGGHFEPKITPVGNVRWGFRLLDVPKIGFLELESTGSTHFRELTNVKVVPVERAGSKLLESKIKSCRPGLWGRPGALESWGWGSTFGGIFQNFVNK